MVSGISPLQFKHIDGGQNWYLKGELSKFGALRDFETRSDLRY